MNGGSLVTVALPSGGAPRTAQIGPTVAIPLVDSTISVVTVGTDRVLVGTTLWNSSCGIAVLLMGTAGGRLLWRLHRRGLRTVFR